MSENNTDNFGNICTILGGALLGMAIVEQAAKSIVPDTKKALSGDFIDDIKSLPFKQEKKEDEDKHEKEYKKRDDEITELKRKLSELEGKSSEIKKEN